jgi:myo-inositol-1-phosphate synthase
MKTIVFYLSLLAAVYVPPALSSDSRGEHAVKGIGNLMCSDFVQAKDLKKSNYFQFGGWIEGFISASNIHLPKTFDISPWQTTETIATIIYTACNKNPSVYFSIVVSEVVIKLSVKPLREKSEIMTLINGKYSVKLPRETYEKVVDKLITVGILKEQHSEKDVNQSLVTYQQRNNLPITGLPDQYTLWKILD